MTDSSPIDHLRDRINTWSYQAVKRGGVNRDWVNSHLARLGVDPVTGTATYRLNAPMTGLYGRTVTANSRAEALAAFGEIVAAVNADRQINDCSYLGHHVYDVQIDPSGAAFFSGPDDPPAPGKPVADTYDEVVAGFRDMLKEGVLGYGWNYEYARRQLAELGAEPLPKLTTRTVNVPVSGTAKMSLAVFADSDDEQVQDAIKAQIGRAGSLNVVPEEIGTVVAPASSGLGFTIADE